MYSVILVSAHHLAYTCSLFLQLAYKCSLFLQSSLLKRDQIDLTDHGILHAEIPPAIDENIYPPCIAFICHEGNWITC